MYSSACDLNLTIHFLSQHFDNANKHAIDQHQRSVGDEI